MRRKILLTILMAAFAFGQKAEDPAEQEATKLRYMEMGREVAIQIVEERLAEARKKYKPEHPKVKEWEAELARVRALPPVTPFVLPKINALPDQWWKDPATIQSLGLTPDQQKRIGGVFEEYRGPLIEKSKAWEVADITLEALIGAGSRNDKRIGEAIDRVAESRAELEKVRSRMLVAMRNQFTPEQWIKISRGPALTRR